MQAVVIIPARYGSTRFEGKALASIAGKPMIQHVYERACRSATARRVCLATDDERIMEAARKFGGEAVLTSEHQRSGTDRVAEAADLLGLDDHELVVNIQGDQPLFGPIQIDQVLEPLAEDPDLPMSTLIYRITNPAEIDDPNIVKTVFDRAGRALYFSRATIPHLRDSSGTVDYYKHHGIYAYRRHFLRTFSQWPTSTLEEIEKLEQLRALEHGAAIRIVISDLDSLEVDTPADARKVERILKGR